MAYKKNKLRGFTLVELLVVISIIALLMAILVPALNRVRGHAKATACRSNIRELGQCALMYTNENDYKFFPGYVGGSRDFWMKVLEPYYKDKDLLFCPMATKELPGKTFGSRIEAWGPSNIHAKPDDEDFEGYYGSLGLNLWVCNASGNGLGSNSKANHCWKHTLVKRSGEIPLFADALIFGGLPLNVSEEKPENVVVQTENEAGGLTLSGIGYFCLNRHYGYINMVYLDFSVKQVALKQLWNQLWHKNYDVNEKIPYSEFPTWMRSMPND